VKIVAIGAALAVSAVGVAIFVRALLSILGVLKIGQRTSGRTDLAGERWKHLLAETLGHTRMLQWRKVGIAHWFVFIAFGALFLTLVTAYGQLLDPGFVLPWIGDWIVYEWATELIAWLGLVAIVFLMLVRFRSRSAGRFSRFFGSRTWQAVYVELTILGIVVCVLTLRALEFRLLGGEGDRAHFPLTWFLLPSIGPRSLVETGIVLVAAIKIIISMAWFLTIGLNLTMGVAWHRFTAWPNIWFKREASGRPALGALPPLRVDGKPVDFADLDELDEDALLGVGKIEDFSWKGLLDFTSCTECGRCQSQCPAWNTQKPLSPKLLVMDLREHAYAKAPYLQAAEAVREQLPEAIRMEAARPLVGPIQVDGGVPGVIDPDVLWSCTSCGACVQQCPVDIEHVDHIMDMRRFQVMMESDFPSELQSLFKGLESKGNPWSMSPRGRMDWAASLPFDVPVVGKDIDDLVSVEYLLWVGCAGAFEDRAKKTTQAVAELLHLAGVRFAVLGNGETCTGDPARRAGNELVFQQLALQNVETLKESKATKVVATCAHCVNTLKNEYPQVGVELEVVHHTQLLNRLVRDGRLTPVAPPEGSVDGRTITYHDPCFLGRHNTIYDPPRELLKILPNTSVVEMPRSRERSFCCGAGGARMWMEEKLGTRINDNRTEEALATLAAAPTNGTRAAIATACPFCRVMLSDGVSERQPDGAAASTVEVLDVAQLLLASVRRN
jgi:Fe-S oxidoreductase